MRAEWGPMLSFHTFTYDVQIGREQPLSRNTNFGVVQHVVVAVQHIQRPRVVLVVVEVGQGEAAPVRICSIISLPTKNIHDTMRMGYVAYIFLVVRKERRANGQGLSDASISVRERKVYCRVEQPRNGQHLKRRGANQDRWAHRSRLRHQ